MEDCCRIDILESLGDNYIYMCRIGNGKVLAVDPGSAAPVLQYLEETSQTLSAVFLTHHHGDHTGGTRALKSETGCRVFAPSKACFGKADQLVEDKQTFPFGDLQIQVLATPGHTRDSVCYYLPSGSQEVRGILFSGDTLFLGGCGRLFEGSAEDMFRSFQKIRELPGSTSVFPGHEYTEDNYRFALSVDPDNPAFASMLEKTQRLRTRGIPSVPGTLEDEWKGNIFYLSAKESVKIAVGKPAGSPVEVFAELRKRKNRF